MFNKTFFFTIFLSSSVTMLSADIYDVYLNDMSEHKRHCMQELAADPKRNNPSYPMSRVLLTITGSDSDDIPKVPHAGKIFEEKGVSYQLMHNGVKVLRDGYYDAAWLTDIIYALKGHHEPQEEKAFYEVLKYIPENGTMLELGAYWGYYSIWFAQALPKATNYLVEGNPKNLELGRQNFKLNNCQANFYPGYIKQSSEDEKMFPNSPKISIDQFLKKEGITHLNILHSDIQGAEGEMLKTAQQAMKSNMIDYFFISTHSAGIHQACCNYLRHFGYTIIAEHGMHESCSVDGLIVAKRKDVKGPNHIPLNKYK